VRVQLTASRGAISAWLTRCWVDFGCLASLDRAVNCKREGFQFGVHDRGHFGHGFLRPRRELRRGLIELLLGRQPLLGYGGGEG
jgi:hypothetical protein